MQPQLVFLLFSFPLFFFFDMPGFFSVFCYFNLMFFFLIILPVLFFSFCLFFLQSIFPESFLTFNFFYSLSYFSIIYISRGETLTLKVLNIHFLISSTLGRCCSLNSLFTPTTHHHKLCVVVVQISLQRRHLSRILYYTRTNHS